MNLKRYASHYLMLPGIGYLKRQVVELSEKGTVERIFPLEGELESVEWLPGVIALLPEPGDGAPDDNLFFCLSTVEQEGVTDCIKQWWQAVDRVEGDFVACLYAPFDFTAMRPVGGIQRKLLR
ncbi:MAG: hypothetical protein LBN24_05470 [Mediterranea sp.]|jgi:hypothetical protein|nr:hypothetical protein [Mediterranea sp.]